MLPGDLGERLFPSSVRRTPDWNMIQRFMTTEHASGTREAAASKRIAGAVDNDASWGMKIADPRPRTCIECEEEVPELEPLRLCRRHKGWYRVATIMQALAADPPGVDLKRFNDARRTRYRARFLTREGVAGWEERRASKAHTEET